MDIKELLNTDGLTAAQVDYCRGICVEGVESVYYNCIQLQDRTERATKRTGELARVTRQDAVSLRESYCTSLVFELPCFAALKAVRAILNSRKSAA